MEGSGSRRTGQEGGEGLVCKYHIVRIRMLTFVITEK